MTQYLAQFHKTAEPSESNDIETIVRLTLSQNQRDLLNNNLTQLISNSDICNPSQNNMTQSQDQSTIILQ